MLKNIKKASAQSKIARTEKYLLYVKIVKSSFICGQSIKIRLVLYSNNF